MRGLLLLAFAGALAAQDFRATLNGTVLDSSGAVVPKAQVEVRNIETSEVRRAVTQGNGQFSVPFLPLGTYTAAAEAPGFRKVVRENIVLRAGQAFGIELTLQPGIVTDQIVVSAEPPLLETEKSDRGTVIDTARITELPPVSRNPVMLAVLVAGVTFRGGSNRVFDQSSMDQWSVNGSPSSLSNSFVLDGAVNKALQGQNYIGYLSKFITESGYNDVQQGIKNRGLDGGDIPRRATMGGVYTLPFGKGGKLLTTSHPVVSRLVGHWQLGWVGQWSAGTPLGFPSGSILYVKDARLPNADWGAEVVNILKPCVAQWNTNNTITLQPFSVAAGCTDYNFLILPTYAPRQVPSYFPSVRNYSYPNLDLSLSKSTAITERVRLQLRADAYNASNSVGRATAATGTTDTNFGKSLKLNSRGDTYRTIQLSLKLLI